MTTDSKTECVICGFEIGTDENGWDGGHNAEPVAKGQCCGDCNDRVVLVARLKQIGFHQMAETMNSIQSQGK